MTTKLFDDILLKGIRSGQMPARQKASREWFRTTAKAMGSKADADAFIRSGKGRFTNNPRFGSMYLFAYDAKHKKTLPYWDRYPLVFPFAQAKGGMLSLNMHYLDFKQRAVLMDRLYALSTDENYDEKTKLKFSYQTLNEAAKFKHFAPCVKHHLRSQTRSRFVEIAPSEWDMALMLPLHKFQGASATKVWQDSRKIIRERKR